MKVVDRNGVEIRPGVKLAWVSHSGNHAELKIGIVQDIKINRRSSDIEGYDVIIRARIQKYSPYSYDKQSMYLARLPETLWFYREPHLTELRIGRAEVVG